MLRRGDIALVRRYVYLATRIAQRCRIKLPKRYRVLICKRCYTLLIPGKTCSVRVRGSYIIKRCLLCGNVIRTRIK